VSRKQNLLRRESLNNILKNHTKWQVKAQNEDSTGFAL
jgi:hypothetical protein